MKYIGRFLGWILLGINLCMVVLLLVCAYSPYIDPVAHPVWSCAGLAFPAFLIVNLLFLVLPKAKCPPAYRIKRSTCWT